MTVLRQRPVVAYTVLAYAISWACWLPLAVTGQVVVVGGWPTHLPGLLGPALAAFVVTLLSGGNSATRRLATRRLATRRLAARLVRWRIGWWWIVALSPIVMLVVGVAVELVRGESAPAVAEYGQINGFPTWGVLAVVVLLVVVNGLGEETGWRGFLQPALQRHMRPLYAMGVVAVIWTGWHAPMFAILSNFRSFDAVTLVGFFIGLLSGAIVLGWLYNKTGSVLAVAVWHATYNLTSATEAAHGLPAAISTTVVIIAAIVLVAADLVTHGRVLAPTNRSEVLPRSGPSPRPLAAATQQAQEYRNSDRRLR